MEILACSSWHSRASRPCIAGSSILSPTARSSRVYRRVGSSVRESQTDGVLLSLAAPGRNFRGGCLRLIAAASSGKNGKKPNERKGGGKTKSNPEGKSAPDKKQAKANVWSPEFPSGKSVLQEQQVRSASTKTESERSGGGGGGGGRGRGTGVRGGLSVVDNGGGDVRAQDFNVATSNVAASERRKHQQHDDRDDTMFLRYLSPLLPVVEETELQPEEPVPNPLFSTFCSNAAGVWRGVGATFSPITGDFEPIYLDEDKRDVYDVRVVSTVENLRTSPDGALLPPEQQSLHRTVQWSLKDPVMDDGESPETVEGDEDDDSLGDAYEEVDELGYLEDDEDTEEDEDSSDWDLVLADPGEVDERWEKGEEAPGVMEEIEDTGPVREDETDWNLIWDRREVLGGDWEEERLPDGESGNSLTDKQTTSFGQSSASTPDGPSYDEGLDEDSEGEDVMEEDVVTWEPGLVFFEDGAYSRGPLELLTDASSSSREYFNADTYKVEQCLVAGGHKRLRIVHTVSIEEGEKIEVLRLAVYEEEWMGPCNMKSISDSGGHCLELFSERARHSPEDVVGKWKVFQVEAMAIHPVKASEKVSFAFSCKETSIKREFPAMPKLTIQDDDSVDLSDFSTSWLTGNVSTFVSLGATGALTFGVGWLCEDGTRLVMERAYGEDGKLLQVYSKSEIRAAR